MDHRARRAEQARCTERELLRAAAELSRERGFDRMSIRDVCRRAGVTTGAFYHHFASKEELLTRGFSSLDAYMESYMAGHEGEAPVERMRTLLEGYAAFFEEMGPALVGRYYQQRLGSTSFSSLSPERYTLRAMLECLRQCAEIGALPKDCAPEWMAEFLFRHFRGAVIDWLLHRGEYPLLPKLEQDCVFFERMLQK